MLTSSSLAHAHMLRHTQSLLLSPSALSLLPPIFFPPLSLTHIALALEHVGVRHIP